MTTGVPNSGSEQDLIRKVRQRDTSAMKTLYGQYVGYLTAVCARYIPDDDEVKDILQDKTSNHKEKTYEEKKSLVIYSLKNL